MIKNYLKIAWRNLLKSAGYSTINIVGLAVGMAVTLLIGLWIYDELTFDRYHKDHSRVGQVLTTQAFDDNTETAGSIVVPLGNALRTQYANDFKKVALTSFNGSHILSVGEKKISQYGIWSEPDLPAILSLKLRGDANSLKDPSSLMLSQSVANALFGNEEPLGKVLRVDNKADMTVAGIYEDLPSNTSLHETKFLLSWNNPANRLNQQTDQWQNHGSQLFVELNNNVDFSMATAKIKDLVKPYVTEWKEELLVHPMDKWHLYNEFENGKVSGGRIRFVWLFGAIGIFVLLLACINFMNLSTARSEKRAKEIGIRKAIGSVRKQLIGQFLSESMVITSIAMLLSLLFLYLSLPLFNNLAGKSMVVPFGQPVFWLFIVGFTFLTGLVAGSYPAFYLSGFNAINILKGTFRVGRLAVIPRKVLVVVQFGISIALIIGTVVVFRQIQFTKNRPLGYSREGLITIDMNTPDLYKDYNSLRIELLQTRVVEDMAEANSVTTEIWSNNTGFDWKGKDPGSNPLFGTIAVTHDYGKTVGWKVISGRDFSRNSPADSGAFILNESAVKLAGIKDPIGKIMRWNGEERVITGVVKDMIMESPYEPTHPTIFHMQYGWVNKIILRIKPSTPLRKALESIREVFSKYNPSSPFEYKFVDEAYAQKFALEERIGKLAGFFGILAILISCLGLFGLSSFIAGQRAKEISIRKVLGASEIKLWGLLTKEFVGLVVIAMIVTIPFSYFFMKDWLQDYQYRTELSFWIFAAAAAATLLVTLLTVSFQAIRAALANPVKGLRSE